MATDRKWHTKKVRKHRRKKGMKKQRHKHKK